ncbi:MAG: hypothetical protein HQ561_10625 [Desulfobacteraceae bacterium]|nr:hypothetical protein [Desulfobacteraceae bacterium]
MRNAASVTCLILIGIFFLPFRALATCEDENVITWLVLDLPPLFLTKGPDKGKGLADRIQDMVADQLEAYRSVRRVANASRIGWELKGDKCVCFAGEFYGNPDYLTSIPTIAMLPHKLIVRKSDIDMYGDAKSVSLDRLLGNKKLVFGTASDRLYGPELDAVLKKHEGAKNIYRRTSVDTLGGLLGMMLKGRVDYLVEYPVAVNYAAKKAGVWDQLAILAIEENSDAPPIRGAIRCTDTEWGRKVIEEVNAILRKIRPSEGYRKIVKEWVVPPRRKKEYWKIYESQVLRPAEEDIYANTPTGKNR